MKDIDPYYKNVPIAVFTANVVMGNKETAQKFGFNDFLIKPINVIKLNSILEKWIPNEKKIRSTQDDAKKDTDAENEINKLIIEGLDTEKGIAMTGGKKEQYITMLSFFYKDGLKKIEEIRASLEAENINLYAIYVHALKSATAIIGSEKLSQTAKALENAAKNEDIDFIYSNNCAFLADFESILYNINVFLEERAKKSNKKLIDMELLELELSNLKTGLENFDPELINSAAVTLQDFTHSGDIGDFVSNILKNKLLGEYEEAILQINMLLQKTNQQNLK